jgi:DNA polymerase-3 subunit epsilon
MKFVALDFETANESLDSICQIGVASFADGSLVGSWETLVDPEDDFSDMNTSIHGITADCVKGSPKFPDIFGHLCKLLLDGEAVAHHTCFDKAALSQTLEKYELDDVSCAWLDTARVVRRTWPECARRGFGLAPVAKMLGIEFRHHSALEDARAAGEILLRAITHTGLDISAWLVRVARPINPASATGQCARDGNPEGPLFGETVVFTGTLSLVRSEAADLASNAGCDVADRVTKDTTLLVVGDQDIRKLVGHQKSSKHRKAEELIAKGQAIRILTQTDFENLLGLKHKPVVKRIPKAPREPRVFGISIEFDEEKGFTIRGP